MALQAGAKAPDFKVKDQNGNWVALKDFKGSKVALYFYPKDNTATCTVEACNLRDNFEVLKAKGVIVIGVSVDDEKSHQKFITKQQLPFMLLADTEKEMVNAYGVWDMKKFMGRSYMGTLRTTFLINEKGKIDHIITKVNSKDHAAQIMEVWGIQ